MHVRTLVTSVAGLVAAAAIGGSADAASPIALVPCGGKPPIQCGLTVLVPLSK